MNCPECGGSAPEGARFCAECGSQLGGEEPRLFCGGCGAEVSPQSKFCPRCGQGRGPSPSGGWGSRVFYYRQKAGLASGVAHVVEKVLKGEDLMTQVLSSSQGWVVQGRRPPSLLRLVTGLDLAISVEIIPEGSDLRVGIGAGKWADKAAGAAIGYFVFWPLLVTSGFGAYLQTRLYTQVEAAIDAYLK